MHDWIEELGPGHRVLDLASGPGSLPGTPIACTLVSLDEDVDAFASAFPPRPGEVRIFATSHTLPFAAATFDLVVAHHCLEHIAELEGTLAEIRRVLKPDGRLFVSVPNGHGLCDGIYRFVFSGGGHLHRFRKDELVRHIEGAVGVRLVKWQKLYSSFVYLWRMAQMMESPPPGLSARLRLIGRLPRRAFTLVQGALYSGTRGLDRRLGTGLSLYGWAFWFDRAGAPVTEEPAYVNVCRWCGTGLASAGMKRLGTRQFVCAICGGPNRYSEPFANGI